MPMALCRLTVWESEKGNELVRAHIKVPRPYPTFESRTFLRSSRDFWLKRDLVYSGKKTD